MDYEKLGTFFLGHVVDQPGAKPGNELLLYDAKDLTTHGLCVGMTGSGKTGLCLAMLEEAAIDGIPAIAIDPKGDLGNLLLAFPQLRPADFSPWIDPAEAARSGRTPAEQAAHVAARWRQGLAGSAQPPARIARYCDTVEAAIYTPGSNAGLPLSVLGSLVAPPSELLDESDEFRDRVHGAVASLLALLGIDADPLRSREYILLATIVQQAWQQGRDLDLGQLIRATQKPPVQRVGILELEDFFPQRERQQLAMQLNNLLASPGFAAWTRGEPLNIDRLLYTAEGKPRLSILSIAHLAEPERMFFVSVLLHELVAWMRTQPGTSSLRALLYMDEVFGFLPPVANPPSKAPMLTLLKQARAFGLGVLLATQNPVDLDYKALANCGSWFLGRLQTERDVARVLDGLQGAANAAGKSLDRSTAESMLAGLRSRVFLMNNVHDDAPTLFRSRWLLSYLRGPLTRTQIRTLMADRRGPTADPAPTLPSAAIETDGTGNGDNAQSSRPNEATDTAAGRTAQRAMDRPLLDPEVEELFLHTHVVGSDIVYRPGLLADAHLHYVHRYSELDQWLEPTLLASLSDGPKKSLWQRSSMHYADRLPLVAEPLPDARFERMVGPTLDAKRLKGLASAAKNYLYRREPLVIWYCRPFKLWSRFRETRAQFAARVGQLRREKRDLQIEKLKARFAPKFGRLRSRLDRAQQRVQRQQGQQRQQQYQTAVSVGATVLGALLGRRSLGRATTAVRGAGRVAKEGSDVTRAQRDAARAQQQLAELELDFQQQLTELQQPELTSANIEDKRIAPRKADVDISRIALVWMPWRTDGSKAIEPVWRELGRARVRVTL